MVDTDKVKICKNCGKPFLYKRKNNLFCSTNCCVEYHNSFSKDRICRFCGEKCYGKTCRDCYSKRKHNTVSRLVKRFDKCGVVKNV